MAGVITPWKLANTIDHSFFSESYYAILIPLHAYIPHELSPPFWLCTHCIPFLSLPYYFPFFMIFCWYVDCFSSTICSVQFSSVQLLSHVQLFVTPQTEAPQASLPITSSQSFLKFMSIESVKPSNHLILCCPLLLLPSILDGILKSRDMTLPTKVHIVKAMIFPVVMCRCKSWTIKKSECRRTDAFKLWCWRRLLRVLYTARRSSQSITQNIHWKD